MATQKTKSAPGKSAGANAKAKTSRPVSGKSKSVKSAKTATAKKPVGESKKARAPAVKRALPPTPKPKSPRTKAAPASIKPDAKISPEERYRMVETAAYFIAEQHGFQGRSDEHWAAAERAIASKLGQ